MAPLSMNDSALPFDDLPRHQARLVHLAARLIADHHRGEDLAQEGVLRLLRTRKPPREGAHGAWLSTAVGYLAANERRSSARRRHREHAAARVEALPSSSEIAERAELLPWTHRRLCREFAVQDPAQRLDRQPEMEWVTGVYRNFYVTNHFQVCNACFDYLLDGGEFASALRHRGKIGFLVLAAVVLAAILLLPDLLPVLKSAFWLEKGE